MFVAVVCAVAAGCGSGSTGETSSAAVITKAQSIAGTEGKLLQSRILVQDGGTGPVRTMTMVIACKPDGGCEVVAPDGVSYPDLQSFVDDTKLLEPGDHVLGAANMTSPGEKVRSQEFVKSGGLSWGWYAGGAGVLVVVVLAAWWLVLRVRPPATRRSPAAGDRTTHRRRTTGGLNHLPPLPFWTARRGRPGRNRVSSGCVWFRVVCRSGGGDLLDGARDHRALAGGEHWWQETVSRSTRTSCTLSAST